MDIWNRISDSYDALDEPFRTDRTEEIDAGLDRDTVSLQYFQTPISLEDAIDEALGLARQLRAGTLDPIDPQSVGFRTGLDRTLSRDLERRHSHSSVETVRQCQRRHVLDHVVRAFEDPLIETVSASSHATASPIAIGTLFHYVAEEAFWRDYTDRDEWVSACTRLGWRHGLEDAISGATACIDRYFATAVAGWESLGAEVPFELADYDGSVAGSIIGEIDAIKRDPEGEIVILDYKTGSQRKELGDSYQLLLYLLAARDVFATPIRRAGYVYVGTNGPEVQLFSADQLLDMRPQLTADLQTADDSEFGNARAGPHCQDCVHTSLGCADDVVDR